MIEKTTLAFVADNTLPVTMKFNETHPLEVRFDFGQGTEWIFSRDLLTVGAVKSTGEGDVKIAPAPEGMVRLTLDSPFGHADIDVSLQDVLDFLNSISVGFASEEEAELVEKALDEFIERELGAME